MKYFRHIIIVISLLVLLVGIPVYATGYVQRKLSGVDSISSASVIIEQPSGEYVVLINKDYHHNADNLDTWCKFFRGEEIDYLFEDISLVVADNDSAGIELSKSFQSRLPENQMSIRTEDATLMLSKAYYGKFDVLLMSKEIFEAFHGEGYVNADTTVIIEAGD